MGSVGTRHDSDGRARHFRAARTCLLATLVALVLALPSAAWGYTASPVLSRAAEVPVWCWSDSEWSTYSSQALAFYAPESGSVDRGAHLPARTCARLVRASYGWRPDPGLARQRLAMAVFTLAHEVGHAVFPSGTELDANCIAAATTFWRIGARLGIGWRYRLALARIVAARLNVPCWPRSV
jgi:hypothetical protein